MLKLQKVIVKVISHMQQFICHYHKIKKVETQNYTFVSNPVFNWFLGFTFTFLDDFFCFVLSSSANKCLLKVAQFSATLEKYDRAIEIYEQVSNQLIVTFCVRNRSHMHTSMETV